MACTLQRVADEVTSGLAVADPVDMTGEVGATESVAARLKDVVFSYQTDGSFEEFESNGSVSESDVSDEIVLRGVDVAFPRGDMTVILGASGSGKSTLVKTLNALVPSFHRGHFKGDVEVLGSNADTRQTAEMAGQVSMALQDYDAGLFGTTVESEVAFGPENLGVPPAEIAERIDSSLERVGLDHLDENRDPEKLSGGQKQRLALASVLATRPELLVLDEPTSDLDPRGRRDVVETIASIADGVGRTDGDGRPTREGPASIVMVTHSVEEALLADRAVLFDDGEVQRRGAVRDVFRDVRALRACRVEVPPLVAAFDRLGWKREELPLLPEEAAAAVRKRGLDWDPPARRGDPLPGVPAGTGEDPGDPVFELDGVTFEYDADRGRTRAIEDLDLSIRAGEVVGIVGPNGSGKTTLGKHLNGLLEPTRGSVRFRGRDLSGMSTAEIGREVGYVFQNPDHQLFASTVEEEVAFGPKNFGLQGDALDCRVERAIEAVELESLAEDDPFTLSKGERQRVALAGILATEPEVIVLDEPTTGLDVAQGRAFMDLLARLNRERRVTLILITHDLSTVARYAPRTVVLDGGRKVADGPTRELFADGLDTWGLAPPHVVEFSNRLGGEDTLPALSVDEIVTSLEKG